MIFPHDRRPENHPVSVSEVEQTDEQLAEFIQRRDESADAMQQAANCFEQLYQRHARLLLAFLASRVNRSDLEDIHQTVWQKIWQNLPKHFKGGNFRAWLFQITRNHLVDVSRKRRPDELGEGQEPVDDSGPDDPLADQERQEILGRCLEKMQKHLAEIVRGRLSGEDYTTICSRLQIKAARAHKLFFHAREQLTGCVQKAMQ